jgi:hypothetical protein
MGQKKRSKRARAVLAKSRRDFLMKLGRWGFVGSSVLANIKTLTGWPPWGAAVPSAPASVTMPPSTPRFVSSISHTFSIREALPLTLTEELSVRVICEGSPDAV